MWSMGKWKIWESGKETHEIKVLIRVGNYLSLRRTICKYHKMHNKGLSQIDGKRISGFENGNLVESIDAILACMTLCLLFYIFGV